MAILFVLIKCQSGMEKSIKKEITEINSVKTAHLVTGEYDIIAKLEADSTSQLQSVVLGKIRNISNIMQTVSLPVIDM
ncbi:MAG: Lrp/AsnC family transcriptional regulator [Candidatus Thorarchaeota archaeon]